jgi:glutamyl-tRNA synthetase
LKEKKLGKIIEKLALQNALRYEGTAKVSPVINQLLSEIPDLKTRVKDLVPLIARHVKKINALSYSEQTKLVDDKWPELLIREKKKLEEKILPPLPNVQKYSVVHLRFCPNPDGALHLGGARAAILDDEYSKLYKGFFTLRFDDTDPRTKSPLLEAYDWIREDLDWLDIEWHNEVYQSDRFEIYYGYAVQLFKMGAAYVCGCKPEIFRRLISAKKTCRCREYTPEENLERWNRMLNGSYFEGEAVVRIKTDLNHPNPAVREWPALRIIDIDKYPHPRTGKKYRVWPLFAFCCGIDDHELKISHILRGKEHLTNSVRQHFLYDYLGWEYPEAIHYGRLKMPDSVLSKSKIRKGIEKKEFHGWDDPRLGTLKALRRRGYSPKTLRQFIISIGPKPVDVTVSWKNIMSINRKILDTDTNRYFFVANPIEMKVDGASKIWISQLPLHPDFVERGFRIHKIFPKNNEINLLISKNDYQKLRLGKIIRLIGLFNVKIEGLGNIIEANYHSEEYNIAKKMKIPLIQWIPKTTGVKTTVIMSDSIEVKGLSEDACRTLKKDVIIQFERFGFVRIDNINLRDDEISAYFAHR